jgi:MSHA biogenesis protein MshK
MARRLTLPGAVLCALAMAPASGQALAQALSDPTRPPALGDAAGEAAPAAAFRLQSVLISRGRRIAVIDGRTVVVGDKVGDATLAAIAETEVSLKRGEERETLKLYPGVERKPVRRRAPAEVKR